MAIRRWLWWLSTAFGWINNIYENTLVRAMWDLYFGGNTWKSHTPEDICYEITHVSAKFWATNDVTKEQCRQEMERNFQTWYMDNTRKALLAIVFIFVMIPIISAMLWCCCCFSRGWRLFTPQQMQQQQPQMTITPDELRRIIAETMAAAMINNKTKNN